MINSRNASITRLTAANQTVFHEKSAILGFGGACGFRRRRRRGGGEAKEEVERRDDKKRRVKQDVNGIVFLFALILSFSFDCDCRCEILR